MIKDVRSDCYNYIPSTRSGGGRRRYKYERDDTMDSYDSYDSYRFSEEYIRGGTDISWIFELERRARDRGKYCMHGAGDYIMNGLPEKVESRCYSFCK